MRRKQARLSALVTVLLLAGCLVLLPPAPAAQAADKDPYSQDVQPLPRGMTTVDCARCHFEIFTTIKTGRGAHRIPCRQCHKTFHSFRHGLRYQDVLPHCTDCHDHPHGDADRMTACKQCHQKPHAPLASLDIEQLQPFCADCHGDQAAQLADHPGSHSKLACNDCHSERHGNIPRCSECHEKPHTTYVSNKGCTACHPAHMPQEVRYGTRIDNATCAGCHTGIGARLKAGRSAHSMLRCVFCHSEKHGTIPSCQDCHGIPHSAGILQGFSDCLDCHGDPHKLSLGAPH
ncbi:MAG TPA: hypothetical protein ENK27_02880 [Desulfobulbus sp.]|nr:hypothetical protein [Desulfobulbus sp.]